MENITLEKLKQDLEQKEYVQYCKDYLVNGKHTLYLYVKEAKYSELYQQKVRDLKKNITLTVINPDSELRPLRDSWFEKDKSIVIVWKDKLFDTQNHNDTIAQRLHELYEDFFFHITRYKELQDGYIKCKVKNCDEVFWLSKIGNRIYLSYKINKKLKKGI